MYGADSQAASRERDTQIRSATGAGGFYFIPILRIFCRFWLDGFKKFLLGQGILHARFIVVTRGLTYAGTQQPNPWLSCCGAQPWG